MQYDSNNTDNVATIDGKNAHHGLGSIAIANGTFSNLDTRQTSLPGEKKQGWPNIESIEVIPIKKSPCTRETSAQPDCSRSSRPVAIQRTLYQSFL